MIILVLLAVLIGIVVTFVLRPDTPPLLGVYSRPGKYYWLKYYLVKFALERRRKAARANRKRADYNVQQWGGDGHRDTRELEAKQVLPEGRSNAADCVFFDGSNAEGFYLTLGTAQRPNDVINLFFIVRIPDVGTFVSKSLHYNTNVKSVKCNSHYKTECGFDVVCVEPMRRWRLKFDGILVRDRNNAIDTTAIGGSDAPSDDSGGIRASFDFEWTNFGDHFDFDLECSSEAIAHSLAVEPWNREIFARLKRSHQVHYEQFGFLEGEFAIGDRSFKNIRLTSMRDHTITAYRAWNDLRRYIMIIYHLEDGTCVHTSLISMPGVVFSHLQFGYVITPDKQKLAVDKIDFCLADIGEDKHFPDHFSYSFRAGSRHFNCKVKIIETTTFRMGLEQSTFVNENMCEFEVNGLSGRGFAECEYRIAPY